MFRDRVSCRLCAEGMTNPEVVREQWGPMDGRLPWSDRAEVGEGAHASLAFGGDDGWPDHAQPRTAGSPMAPGPWSRNA